MIAGSLDTSALARAIDHVGAAAADWHEPFAEMGQDIRDDYASRWARKGPGWGTDLVKTGALRSSFTEVGARGNVTEVGPTEARFGSDLPYAETLQTGEGRRANAKPIAREPGPALRNELAREAADHIARAWEGYL